jgi:AraC-like DNA-binding protein
MPPPYREVPLAPPLDRWVECVWSAEHAADSDAPPQTIVPDGCPELIVQLGDPFRSLPGPRGGAAGGAASLQPKVLLVGPLSSALTIQPTGRVHTVGIRFRPHGVAAFLRAPLYELADRALPLDDVFGASARELAERVAGAHDLDTRAAVVERFLARRFSPRPAEPLARAGVAALIESHGRARIGHLAFSLNLGRRRLERLFRDSVGLTPKRLARIVRIQQVLRRVGRAPDAWVQIALDCGYADQAHLTREFVELAGASPARWLEGNRDFARHFVDPARLDAFFAAGS